jgi:membrane protein
LQHSLNRAWGVEPDPEHGGIKRFFVKRLLSLGMILVMAFLLLVSLAISPAISAIIRIVQGAGPDVLVRVTSVTLDSLLTLFLTTLLFAAIFKTLPDADIEWSDTWLGSAVTAGLFVLGKALIAVYMQQVTLGASWGSAAESIIAVLAWVYYTSLIVLFGAEFTQAWASRNGHGIRPSEGARITAETLQRK